MSEQLVPAWRVDTGAKYPFLVPEHWIDHPVLRPRLTGRPPTGPAAQDGGDETAPPQPVVEETPAGKAPKPKKVGRTNGVDARR